MRVYSNITINKMNKLDINVENLTKYAKNVGSYLLYYYIINYRHDKRNRIQAFFTKMYEPVDTDCDCHDG